MSPLFRLAVLACPLVATACVSVVLGNTEEVSVATTPKSGASCTLQNDKGRWEVPSTPGSVTIYKSSAGLTVRCTDREGDGGTATVAALSAGTDAVSFAVGGLIAVDMDRRSGAAFDYPASIGVPLVTGAAKAAAPPSDAAAPSPPLKTAGPIDYCQGSSVELACVGNGHGPALQATGQPPAPEPRPIDYCQGSSVELACIGHGHGPATQTVGQAPSPEARPVDYCAGMNELVCVDHQHHT